LVKSVATIGGSSGGAAICDGGCYNRRRWLLQSVAAIGGGGAAICDARVTYLYFGRHCFRQQGVLLLALVSRRCLVWMSVVLPMAATGVAALVSELEGGS
jgi:hypothetical protein